MFDYIKYTISPWLKVRLLYWRWVIKYRGKKNIPPELIFGKIDETMAGLKEDLMNALRVMPDNLSEEKKADFLKLLKATNALDEEIKNSKN